MGTLKYLTEMGDNDTLESVRGRGKTPSAGRRHLTPLVSRVFQVLCSVPSRSVRTFVRTGPPVETPHPTNNVLRTLPSLLLLSLLGRRR